MTETFADFEPEDAWSPYDHVRELLDNLAQRLALLDEHVRLTSDADHVDRLDEIAQRLRHWRRTRAYDASERDQVRAHDIARHVQVVRARLGNG